MRLSPSKMPVLGMMISCIIVMVVLEGLSGCQPVSDTKRASKPDTSHGQPAVSEPTILLTKPASTAVTVTPSLNATPLNSMPLNTPSTMSRVADSGNQIANQLELSYAREAANVNNRCPKLVDFQLTNQAITRNGEQLLKDSCDYFVYLHTGDKLQVTVSNNLQAQLVSPTNFDFNQGAYIAPQFDKYTIEIRYNGSRFQPNNLTYNVVLTRSNTSH